MSELGAEGDWHANGNSKGMAAISIGETAAAHTLTVARPSVPLWARPLRPLWLMCRPNLATGATTSSASFRARFSSTDLSSKSTGRGATTAIPATGAALKADAHGSMFRLSGLRESRRTTPIDLHTHREILYLLDCKLSALQSTCWTRLRQ